MIIIRLTGGLGNQMFQYAAARCLALKNGAELKLDTTAYREDQLRNFDLFCLNIKASIATPAEIDALKAKGTAGRVMSYLTPYPRRKFYKQPWFRFHPSFFRLTDPVYLQGYFQSEKYFEAEREQVQKDFTIKKELTANAEPLAAGLQAQESVALHIRRGDYRNDVSLDYHGIVPLDYYREAVEQVSSKVAHPHFYIFSDDGAWVKENLKLPKATIVSGELSSTHFEDLYLMSRCRHNIIANSSFSWWAAWLNANPEKIVIAPRHWFNKGPKDTEDLIPGEWTRT
ncbi:MAG TPA: alpha-1,2-fucosyltransferase [Flavisolibacter sp.]|jgi:hypothetical protein